MRIEIWSDIACPWCYVGKRRLESALETLSAAGTIDREAVDIVYRSFQLDPSAPTEPTQTAREMLAKKYGMSPAQAAEAQDRVTALAAAEGMAWQHDKTLHASTRDAHRLLHLAKETGHQPALKEALLHANFVEARNIADRTVLREVALGVGLPAERVDAVLAGTDFATAVEADQEQAAAYGANGVPFFVFENKYAVSGAQPTELFTEVVEKVWAEAHPAPVQLLATGGADGACGPDGCAI